MNVYTLALAALLCASCILATVASASKMSFVAWLLVGLVSPLLIVVLGAEVVCTRLLGWQPEAQVLESESRL